MCPEHAGCEPLLLASNPTISVSRWSPTHACLCPPPSPWLFFPEPPYTFSLRCWPSWLPTSPRPELGISSCVSEWDCCLPCNLGRTRSRPLRDEQARVRTAKGSLKACSEQQSASSLAIVFLTSLIMFEVALLFTDTEEKALL